MSKRANVCPHRFCLHAVRKRHAACRTDPEGAPLTLLEQLRHKAKTIGIKQTARLVEAGEAACVFIARDADECVVGHLRELCATRGVEVLEAESMKALGKACGIDVGSAVAAVRRT